MHKHVASTRKQGPKLHSLDLLFFPSRGKLFFKGLSQFLFILLGFESGELCLVLPLKFGFVLALGSGLSLGLIRVVFTGHLVITFS